MHHAGWSPIKYSGWTQYAMSKLNGCDSTSNALNQETASFSRSSFSSMTCSRCRWRLLLASCSCCSRYWNSWSLCSNSTLIDQNHKSAFQPFLFPIKENIHFKYDRSKRRLPTLTFSSSMIFICASIISDVMELWVRSFSALSSSILLLRVSVWISSLCFSCFSFRWDSSRDDCSLKILHMQEDTSIAR